METTIICPSCATHLKVVFPDPAPRPIRRPLPPLRTRVVAFLDARPNGAAAIRLLCRRLHIRKADLLTTLHELADGGVGRFATLRRKVPGSARFYLAAGFVLAPSSRN